jgi:hypothetical protein
VEAPFATRLEPRPDPSWAVPSARSNFQEKTVETQNSLEYTHVSQMESFAPDHSTLIGKNLRFGLDPAYRTDSGRH